ncbi:GNAT family N-acetyltransferase [Streptomyces sp. NPDC006733]|uniref:GNAT family N-acetyltransferase n=1 Tax=Streptomyces sp. NPDC006733 TaxID=3155460 RepID=UPI003400B676
MTGRGDVSITPLDLDGAGELDDFYQPHRQALLAERPWDPPACRTAFLGQLRRPKQGTRSLAWGARYDGHPAGVLAVGMTDGAKGADRADIVHLSVHPDVRRRGIGTALLSSAAQHFADTQVRAFDAFVVGSETAPEPGREFAQATGAVSGARYQRLTLHLDARAMDAHKIPPGYAILRWRGGVPPEHVGALAQLSASLAEAEATRSTSERAVEQADADRTDALYRTLRVWGFRMYVSAVRHVATGELVGYSSLGLAASHRRHATQWDTIVRPSHRGHGLGAALKQANMSWAGEHEPELATVTTWNAVGNDAMVRVNEAMGFREDARGALWEWDVAGLA